MMKSALNSNKYQNISKRAVAYQGRAGCRGTRGAVSGGAALC